MKNKSQLILLSLSTLAILVGLTGCGAKGKQFSGFKTPEQGKGIVYVYRPSSIIEGGVYYDVKNQTDNNSTVGTLRNGGFISQEMTPGEKILTAKTESESNVLINVKPNEVTCVKGEVKMGFIVGRPSLSNVPTPLCELEIKETKESIE